MVVDVDPDLEETQEWLDSIDSVIAVEGASRAAELLERVMIHAKHHGIDLGAPSVTDYCNTIVPRDEPVFPGDETIEARIRHFVRWNAAVMVARANRRADGIGGHLATYASAATLYEVGFNHFFRGKTESGAGDQVFFQGHAAPGIYARAFLEGRLTEEQLDGFRREVGGGLPSYPHPRRSDFWEFPTVSMGLGLINAAYQARFNRYLAARGIADTAAAKVWCFAGDGEMDEPESLAAVALAGREHLDNLVMVVNCNLQRLDGPVRGNAKVIQEFEGLLRGAGWNVIKVLWGREWDPLLAADTEGVLLDKMERTLDGEYQKLRVESGAYIREHFFGPDPRLQQLVENLSDDQLRKLRRGGHDPQKVYAAYRAAVEHRGAPTAILAKTVKGWALGPDIEARNATHQIKKMTEAELRTFRDRLELPIADARARPGASSLRPSGEGVCRARVPHGAPPGPWRLPAAAGPQTQAHDYAGARNLPRAAQRDGRRWRPRRQGPLPGSFVTCFAITSWDGESSPSSPTRRAPSGSMDCSASSRSTLRAANATSPSTPGCF